MRRAAVLVPLALAGCFGQIVPDPDRGAPEGFWPEPSESMLSPETLGPILPVSGGDVVEGYWMYDPARRAFVPDTRCNSSGVPESFRLRLAAFRMTRDEVTFEAYGTCVRAGACKPPATDLSNDPSSDGAWDDPRRARKPAGVNYGEARAFCRAHGGDLPTYHQWIRAAEGNAGWFGIKHLTAEVIQCARGEETALCQPMREAMWTALPHSAIDKPVRTLPPAGTNAWDVGPFGHRDLFGGAGEWVREGRRWPEPSCRDYEGGSADAIYVPERELSAELPHRLMLLSRDLWTEAPALPGVESEQAVSLIKAGESTSADPAVGRFYTGFRCAFPPE